MGVWNTAAILRLLGEGEKVRLLRRLRRIYSVVVEEVGNGGEKKNLLGAVP